jgi:Repeat of unknown function (DUF346)
MKQKKSFISIILATLMIVSLCAVLGTTSVSGATMGGTGPATTYVNGGPGLVAVDTSSQVWFNNSSVGVWSSIGGSATSSPAATTLSNSVIYVFVRGTDNALWSKTTTDNGTSWSSWYSLGGQLASNTGPAVCSWGSGRLDVFVQGTDGALWHKWYTGGAWSGWESLGGKLTSSPAAAPPATNQIGVFVRGTDGACWYKEWTGTAWSGWKSLGGQLAPNTGAGVMGVVFNTTTDARGYELFVQGTDNQLWWQEFGRAGSAWSRLPACPEVLSASSPAIAFSFSGHTEVWVSTTSGNLMECFATGNWPPVNTWVWYSETSPP